MKKPNKPTLSPRKHPDPRKPITITIEPEVLTWVDALADNRSERINNYLTRYYQLLGEARRSLRELLSPAEISAIIDVQNGHWYAPRLSYHEISANIEDACRLDGLEKKWGIDGSALAAKITALDLCQIHALCDATERFWHAVGHGEHMRDPAKALD